jgi:hypothetical protein
MSNMRTLFSALLLVVTTCIAAQSFHRNYGPALIWPWKAMCASPDAYYLSWGRIFYNWSKSPYASMNAPVSVIADNGDIMVAGNRWSLLGSESATMLARFSPCPIGPQEQAVEVGHVARGAYQLRMIGDRSTTTRRILLR